MPVLLGGVAVCTRCQTPPHGGGDSKLGAVADLKKFESAD